MSAAKVNNIINQNINVLTNEDIDFAIKLLSSMKDEMYNKKHRRALAKIKTLKNARRYTQAIVNGEIQYIEVIGAYIPSFFEMKVLPHINHDFVSHNDDNFYKYLRKENKLVRFDRTRKLYFHPKILYRKCIDFEIEEGDVLEIYGERYVSLGDRFAIKEEPIYDYFPHNLSSYLFLWWINQTRKHEFEIKKEGK